MLEPVPHSQQLETVPQGQLKPMYQALEDAWKELNKADKQAVERVLSCPYCMGSFYRYRKSARVPHVIRCGYSHHVAPELIAIAISKLSPTNGRFFAHFHGSEGPCWLPETEQAEYWRKIGIRDSTNLTSLHTASEHSIQPHGIVLPSDSRAMHAIHEQTVEEIDELDWDTDSDEDQSLHKTKRKSVRPLRRRTKAVSAPMEPARPAEPKNRSPKPKLAPESRTKSPPVFKPELEQIVRVAWSLEDALDFPRPPKQDMMGLLKAAAGDSPSAQAVVEGLKDQINTRQGITEVHYQKVLSDIERYASMIKKAIAGFVKQVEKARIEDGLPAAPMVEVRITSQEPALTKTVEESAPSMLKVLEKEEKSFIVEDDDVIDYDAEYVETEDEIPDEMEGEDDFSILAVGAPRLPSPPKGSGGRSWSRRLTGPPLPTDLGDEFSDGPDDHIISQDVIDLEEMIAQSPAFSLTSAQLRRTPTYRQAIQQGLDPGTALAMARASQDITQSIEASRKTQPKDLQMRGFLQNDEDFQPMWKQMLLLRAIDADELLIMFQNHNLRCSFEEVTSFLQRNGVAFFSSGVREKNTKRTKRKARKMKRKRNK